MSLTSGVLKKIVVADPENLPVKPVLQILGIKKLQSGGQDRYRLVLSDGDNYYTSAMLATQLNEIMDNPEMEVRAVIQMDRYTCNVIQDTRKVIIILELNMIKGASEVSGKLSDPKQLSDLLVDHTDLPRANNNSRQPLKTAPIKNNAPVVKQQPTNNKPSFYAGKNNAANANSSKNIFPISSLTPYQNRWTIRARITNKSAIRTWSNSKGEGKLFSMDLLDESGEIRATGFNDVVDKFYEMLEIGKVYFITKGSLKTANKQYSSLKNDYEMTLNNDSTIELCQEECDLPQLQFNFRQIKSIEDVNKDGLIDIVGIVKTTSDLQQITTKSSKQVWKRDITIVDQSSASVNATLWGNEAEKFEEYADKNPVVAIKGAKVSDFGGRSLSILNSSTFQVNPDIPEAHQLRGWYDNGGHDEQITSLSGQRMDGVSGGVFKTLAQIKDEGLGMGEKPDYFNVRAFVVFFRKENCMYQACPSAECNKKVLEDNGQFRCEKCDRAYPDFKYRMVLSSNIADFSGNQWLTAFQESAEAVLGTTTEQVGKYKDSDEVEFDKVFGDACFKPYLFKVRAKMETYQDEPKLKCSAVSAAPVNFRQESKRMIDLINQMVEA